MTLDRTAKNPRARRPPAAEETAPAGEALYSIRVTSRLTAIELETLRVWERRYGFPRPQRTSGGTRVYSGADVEVLKLLRRALELGYRPGEVVGKPREELILLIGAASEQPVRVTVPRVVSRPPRAAPQDAAVSTESLVAALIRDDLAALRSGLRQAALALGPKGFLVTLAHPLSVRIGQLWAEGKIEIRHEHMLSECISAQLGVMLTAYEDSLGAPRVLLATLPGERHGLGLEMISLYLAAHHVTPIFLGVDTPPEQIVKATRSHGADAVGLLVTHASDLAIAAKEIRQMRVELPRKVGLWIGGAGGPDLDLGCDGVDIVSGWGELDTAIVTLARRP